MDSLWHFTTTVQISHRSNLIMLHTIFPHGQGSASSDENITMGNLFLAAYRPRPTQRLECAPGREPTCVAYTCPSHASCTFCILSSSSTKGQVRYIKRDSITPGLHYFIQLTDEKDQSKSHQGRWYIYIYMLFITSHYYCWLGDIMIMLCFTMSLVGIISGSHVLVVHRRRCTARKPLKHRTWAWRGPQVFDQPGQKYHSVRASSISSMG